MFFKKSKSFLLYAIIRIIHIIYLFVNYLPPLPADRSNFDGRGALEDDKVKICQGLYYTYYDIYMYYIYYSWISCQIR